MPAASGMSNDASTIALYRLTEALHTDNAVDVTGTYTIPISGTVYSVEGIINDRSRFFSGTNHFIRSAADAALLTALGAGQQITFECFFYPRSGLGDASVQ